ncbi:TIM barrel protein [Brachybacterium fresconis]|uniref:Sugar phosphate isomerase/epimerase n=1 Tax=Brachybacterium fresconis TaxID=173363 RepID=A0ABS4YKT0_9MICO|nr:sugar phosphate isomerase/epimerase [Brachybacterium fresconis]
MAYGIIAGQAQAAAALAAGADYVEPTIVDNVVVPDASGTWGPAPGLEDWAKAPSFAVLCPPELRLSDPAMPQALIEEYLRTVMAAAARCARPGATIVLGSGASRRTPDGVDPTTARARLAQTVRLARDLAAEQGLEAILEPLHRGETDQINDIAEAIAFLDQHGLDRMRVVADLFHVMLEHESFDVVREQGGRVAHAHIADTDRTPPGQGDWPLREFLQALRSGGYDGPVSIECTWADLPREAGSALETVREADRDARAATASAVPTSEASGSATSASPAVPARSAAPGRTAVVNSNGGWCWFQDERALVDPGSGHLLLGSVASDAGADGPGRGGDIDLTIVDLDRLGEHGSVAGIDPVARTLTLHHGLESDDHDNPALWRRADGRWLAVYSRHKSDDLTRWRISEVGDPTRWGPEAVFDWRELFDSPEQARAGGGSRGVTYQNLHQLDGVLYCFVRAINDDPCYLVSDDDGDTWTFGGRLLTREKIGYVNGYARYASGTRFGTDDRIDVIITEHHPRDYPTAIWHGYLADGHLHRSDGTRVGELRRGLSDPTPRAEDLTCVLASGSTWGDSSGIGSNGDGTVLTHAWTTDLRRFPDGSLVALMTARAGDAPGSGCGCGCGCGSGTGRGMLGPIDHRFVRGVLRPGESAWQVRELAAAGPQLLPHEEDYTGLATIDPEDPDALWLSTVVDPRDGTVLAHHEIFHGCTADDGRSWTWTPVTEGSAVDNLRPIAVPGDPGRSVLAWYRGSMASSQAYDAEVMVRVAER